MKYFSQPERLGRPAGHLCPENTTSGNFARPSCGANIAALASKFTYILLCDKKAHQSDDNEPNSAYLGVGTSIFNILNLDVNRMSNTFSVSSHADKKLKIF